MKPTPNKPKATKPTGKPPLALRTCQLELGPPEPTKKVTSPLKQPIHRVPYKRFTQLF